MALADTITDITARLRQGRFLNEQSVSQGVVLRLLQELGWDHWDTTIVWPEYPTGEGRADFALCHPASRPLVVIEVKQPGRAEDSVRQALEYAFHSGVPFVVLTDGRTWSFYLPGEQGSYEDRRVYKLDLYERSAVEAAEVMRRYLGRDGLASGETLETAKKEYRNKNRRLQAKSAIPEAWRELVQEGDEVLVELLSNAVESKAGVRPADDDVVEFLVALTRGTTHASQNARANSRPESAGRISAAIQQTPEPMAGQSATTRRGELELFGKKIKYGTANAAMATVLRELANRDGTLLERCAAHPKAQGKKRRYLGRSVSELYPDRQDLWYAKEELPGGWLVATNLNNMIKMSIIRLAAELAGVTLGKEVVVDL